MVLWQQEANVGSDSFLNDWTREVNTTHQCHMLQTLHIQQEIRDEQCRKGTSIAECLHSQHHSV